MNYSALKFFVQNYLHQDWDIKFKSSDEAVREYLRDYAQARRFLEDVEALLRLDDEVQMGNVLHDDFLMGYLPSEDGLSYREWLRSLAQVSRAVLEE